MEFSTIFFDLDDTVYPSSTGLWEAIRERMNNFMAEKLSLPAEEIPKLRRYYYQTYGTTLRGLQIHYAVDPDDYLAYVHDLALNQYLQPDQKLRSILLDLQQKKWIFTNADADHAQRVLTNLGIEDCFSGIIDVRAMGFSCKPEIEAYEIALSMAGETNPASCIILDDSTDNLATAQKLGFFTILIGSNGNHPSARRSFSLLSDLASEMPELFKSNRDKGSTGV